MTSIKIDFRQVDANGTVVETSEWMEGDVPVGPYLAWAGPEGWTQFQHDSDNKPTGRWRVVRVSHLAEDLNP